MANAPVAQHQAAAQSYVIFDQLPEGCIAFQVPDNRCEPIFSAGELIVVDPHNCAPEFGALFLRSYSSGAQSVVEMVSSPRGAAILVSPRRPRSVGDWGAWFAAGELGGLGDGPFPIEGPHAAYLQSIIVGRVIGLCSAVGDAGALATPIDRRPSPFSHPEQFVLVAL